MRDNNFIHVTLGRHVADLSHSRPFPPTLETNGQFMREFLAHEGMMHQVADAYQTVRDQRPRLSWWNAFKAQLR